ncbi:MAG: polysaccharide pyruvyl transferase family protein [Pseudomonadota bacterium]
MSAITLMRRVRREGAVPLVWQGGAAGEERVPLAGALSPVVVALVTGMPVIRVPFTSTLPRLIASGTIGQNIRHGDAVFWGTGAARTETPPDGRRRRFRAHPHTRRHLAACRGPFSAALLSGGVLAPDALPALGEPAALIAEFHRPTRQPRHELGIVLGPDEDAAAPPGQCQPHAALTRYALDPAGGEGVRLISGLVAPSLAGLRQALDAILACRRIASAAPEALAIARAYGIPALPLSSRGVGRTRRPGLEHVTLSIDGPLELPLADFSAGLGLGEAPVWRQPPDQRTPWARLIAAIDHTAPGAVEEADTRRTWQALADALPLGIAPARPALGASIWDHPALTGIAFAEDIGAMRARERQREEAAAETSRHRRHAKVNGKPQGKDHTSHPAARSSAVDPWAAAVDGDELPLALAEPAARLHRLRLVRIDATARPAAADLASPPPPAPLAETATAPPRAIPTGLSRDGAPLGLVALWNLRRGLAALERPQGACSAALAPASPAGPAFAEPAPPQKAIGSHPAEDEARCRPNVTALRPLGLGQASASGWATHAAPMGAAKPSPIASVAVPLCWAAGARQDGFANVGDALSAVVVAALAGVPVRHTAARSPHERLAAVGTIGHSLKGGHVHLWGTGLDASLHPEREGRWSRPADTRFSVHATRGPETASTLRRNGIAAPEVFGDPVYLLPRLWPLDDVERTYDLGIVLHLSELDEKTPAGRPKAEYRRYAVPESLSGSVRIINMYAESSLTAFRDKIAEIVSCRRILSTSLHGLVIADAYGIPSSWYGFFNRGLQRVDLLDLESRIDHRMRDLYGGLGWYEAPVYATPRHEETDFDAAIAAIDGAMSPSGYDPAPLIEAFPGPIGVDVRSPRWPLPTNELEGVIL